MKHNKNKKDNYMRNEMLNFLSEIKLLLNKGCIINENELNINYCYLENNYNILNYKLSITGNLYFYNKDFAVIYIPQNKDDLWGFLIDLLKGKYKK